RVQLLLRNQSVAPMRPNDPLKRGESVVLTAKANCGELDPGLYRVVLAFEASEVPPTAAAPKDPGSAGWRPAHNLTVEVLVPGRKFEIVAPEPGASRAVGAPVKRRVAVTCFDCEPGEGHVLDSANKKLSFVEEGQGQEVPGLASARRHLFAVTLTPTA